MLHAVQQKLLLLLQQLHAICMRLSVFIRVYWCVYTPQYRTINTPIQTKRLLCMRYALPAARSPAAVAAAAVAAAATANSECIVVSSFSLSLHPFVR